MYKELDELQSCFGISEKGRSPQQLCWDLFLKYGSAGHKYTDWAIRAYCTQTYLTNFVKRKTITFAVAKAVRLLRNTSFNHCVIGELQEITIDLMILTIFSFNKIYNKPSSSSSLINDKLQGVSVFMKRIYFHKQTNIC